MLNCVKILLEKKNGTRLSQYLAVLSANILMFINGIQIGWTSPSLRKILSDDYPFKVSEEEGSYIAVIGFIGDLMGGICGASLINKVGRKNSLLLMAIPYIISFSLIAISNHSMIFIYCARVLGGFSEGGIFAVVPLYAAEVADPNIRGKLGTFQLAILTVGQLFINIITEFMSIQDVAKICLIFPIIFLLIFSQMPETPYYLLSKNKESEATDTLIILRRTYDVVEELKALQSAVKRQQSEQGGFRELFRIPANRKALILSNVTRIFQQLSGTSAYSAYFQLMIVTSTSFPPMLGTSFLLMVQGMVNLSAYYFIDMYGRKTLLVLSASLASTVLFLLGGFMLVKDFTNINTSGSHYFPLMMIFLFIITFNIGMGPIPNVINAEIYSTSIKSKATAFGSLTLSVSMIATIKFYQYTSDHISVAVPFLTFALSTFCSIFFFRFCLIETKGKKLETIQQELIPSK